ncbi:MAG TPA: peroxiredoxin [Planctomicrobium sp.]|nr:peroxiredoxin [Planctomicrobium sp.]
MRTYLVLAAAMGFMTLSTVRSDAMDALKVGDAAPEFSAKDDTGADWKSSDHVGKKAIVVYFYPANMTGGCTKQACKFRDDFSKLKELNIEVVGVSGDNVESHKLFKKAHDLNFTLLADTEGNVAKAFGVPSTPGEKTLTFEVDGKNEQFTRLVTTKRWTFVIGPDGKLVYVNTSVNPTTDSEEVAKAVRNLKKNS